MSFSGGYEAYRIGDFDAFYITNFLSEEEGQHVLRKIHESPKQKWKQLANRRLQIWGRTLTARVPRDLPQGRRWRNYEERSSSPGSSIILNDLVRIHCSTECGSPNSSSPDIVQRLKRTGGFANTPHQEPNHVILNEYQPGQGIMPHEDGPSYSPVVATISLGAHAVFNYYRYKLNQPRVESGIGRVIDQVPVLSVLLEPRSLIISSGDMYTSYLHGIDSVEEDYIQPISTSTVSQPGEIRELADYERSIVIGNGDLLGDEKLKNIVVAGGALRRGTRYSLTCRDVEHVSSMKSFKFV